MTKSNILMELVGLQQSGPNSTSYVLQAKSAKDDALREVLVNRQTYRHVTHRVLQERNAEGQTLLAIIEVNRVNLAESLPIVLKKEYGCHRRDILKTEQCLSRQLESSMSSGQIIMELNDLENSNSMAKRLKIWTILFCRLDTISLLEFGNAMIILKGMNLLLLHLVFLLTEIKGVVSRWWGRSSVYFILNLIETQSSLLPTKHIQLHI